MKIFIDGENFRHGLKNALVELGVTSSSAKLKKYKITDLLCDVLAVDDLEIIYYSSRVKLPQGYKPNKRLLGLAEEIKAESRVWLANVVSQGIELVKAGNLKIKQSKPCHNCRKKQEVLQEKGVDVRLAVDVLELVYEKKPAKIGIFSSDTDLCPAIHKAVNKKTNVVYLCFANSINRAVSAASSQTVSISLEKVKEYYQGGNNAKKGK